jgi:hypothetical protein
LMKPLETREIYEGRLSDLSQLLASRLGRFYECPLCAPIAVVPKDAIGRFAEIGGVRAWLEEVSP